MSTPIDASDPFTAHRSLLFTVAYEMLGTVADAEDVVQDSWLRWAQIDDETRSQIRDQRAYAVRIVTRLALNRLRTLTRRREDYVGEWLPEPLLTAPDVADDVELADNVSIAMLAVLETLAPVERAVFVLREVFGMAHAEIAEATEKSPAAVRQIARRARSHVQARRPRVQVTRAEQEAVVQRFLAAVRGGDLQALLDVMSPDVVVVADGGGKVQAAYRPVSGATKIRQLLALFLERAPQMNMTPTIINGTPALRFEVDGQLGGVVSLQVEDGLITRLLTVANPDKLSHLEREVHLSR